MATEFETQVLEIDPKAIAEKLRSLGAKEVPETLQKRFVFDLECLNSVNPGMGRWIRLRQIGDKTTLTYKNKSGTGISDTQEIEMEVSDFDKMQEILSKLDCFTGKYYQENKRTRFVLEDLEFNIDQWPLIPPFLEIEANSPEKVKYGLQLLGLQEKENAHWGLINIYSKYGIDLHSYKEIKFQES